MRVAVARLNLKGKTIARLSEHLLPLLMRGRGPQYSLGMMAAESLLDTLDGTLQLPRLREQTRRAIIWVETHCRGPVDGSLAESRKYRLGKRSIHCRPSMTPTTQVSGRHRRTCWLWWA